VFTIPNFLTLLRILAVPVLSWLVAHERYQIAMAVFVGASLTDWFDGAVARAFNQQTTLGAYLDPIADKLMMITLYAQFAHMGVISLGLSALVIGRDVGILSGVLVVKMRARRKEITIAPHWISKTNTAIQLFYLLLVFMHMTYKTRISPDILTATAIMVATTTVLSAGVYLYQLSQLRARS
jgi:cardiolipin synthase